MKLPDFPVLSKTTNLEQYFSRANVLWLLRGPLETEESKIARGVLSLQDQYLAFWTQYCQSRKCNDYGWPLEVKNWDTFKKLLLDNFDQGDKCVSALNELCDLKQRGAFTGYKQSFDEIYARTTTVTSVVKFTLFVRGLNSFYKQLVHMHWGTKDHDYDALCIRLKAFETTTPQNISLGFPRVIAPDKDGTATKKRFPQRSRTTPQPSNELTAEEKSQLLKEGRCFRCKQPGHIATSCPLRK